MGAQIRPTSAPVRGADVAGNEGVVIVDRGEPYMLAIVRNGQLTDPTDRRLLDLSKFEGRTVVLKTGLGRIEWD